MATSNFDDIDTLYGATASSVTLSGSDAESTFYNVEDFLDGFKDLSPASTTDAIKATTSITFNGAVTNVLATGTLTVNIPLETDVEASTLIEVPDEIDAGNILTFVDGVNPDETFTATTGDTGANVYDMTGVGSGVDLGKLVDAINEDSLIVDAVVLNSTFFTITAVETTATIGNAITAVVSVDSTVVVDASPLSGGTDADFFTLDTFTFTAVTGTANGDGSEFSIDSGTNAGIATEIFDAIGIQASTVTVTDNSGSVLVTAVVEGDAGNSIVFTTSDATALTLTGLGDDDLSGGVDADTIVLNGITYTAVDSGAVAADAEFDADTDANSVITMIAAIAELDADGIVGTINGDDSSIMDLTAVVGGADGNDLEISSSDDGRIDATTAFTGGVDGDSTGVDNNPAITDSEWPFIQTFDISDNSDVTITYGTGSTAETIEILYDYDDDKDISLDRQKYPDNSYIFIDLDDSLLNLSPLAEEFWAFNADGTVDFYIGSPTLISIDNIDYSAIGFEEGPFEFSTISGVYELSDTEIHDSIKESASQSNVVLFRESNDNDNIFVNYDRSDISNLIVVDSGEASVSYNSAHSIIQDSFNGVIKFLTAVDEWYAGVELEVQLIDEDRNLNSRSDETITILEGEVPYIKIGTALNIDDLTIVGASVDTDNSTASETFDVTTTSTTVTLTGTWPYDAEYTNNGYIFTYVNYDLTALGGDSDTLFMGSEDNTTQAADNDLSITTDTDLGTFTITLSVSSGAQGFAYVDVFSFGQEGDISLSTASPFNGDIEDNVPRVNDAIYRFELEETDDNTATYQGTVEYIMINQLNVFDEGTYDRIDTTGDEIIIIVNEDSDGADAIRVSYNDFDSTENDETISAQEDANTQSGKISLDKEGYTAGNTITVTLKDTDLNTNSDTIQTYDVDSTKNWVGDEKVWLVQLLIDGIVYDDSCLADLGLYDTGFTLIETSDESGIFEGTLKLPSLYCDTSSTNSTTNGKDIEFEYQDYSDSSGSPNETSSSASIRSTTGSITLENTVYGVPIGENTFELYDGTYLDATATKLVIHVDDPDYNVSASGEDTLDSDTITVKISRSGDVVEIEIEESTLVEIAPDAGIFELEVLIYQDTYTTVDGETDDYGLINQGDIITVTYTDESDASGSSNTVTDSATFDLRNGVLQADKSVYVIGSEAIITLIESDLNLDSEAAETWDLALINWDSDAGELDLSDNLFDAQPNGLRETGDNSGIFQVVITIPEDIDGDRLERGEQIELEYTDHGPAGADYVGDDDEEITLTIFTSNFGATIELDQKVYSWTDKVYITVVAPDHNFDSNAIDEIGTDDDSAVNISSRQEEIENYKLVETGTDTGIFTGELILTGFAAHDADGDGVSGEASGLTATAGPTGGTIPTSNDDGLTISFEYSDGDHAIGSALIRWNIGEVQWLEASYPASASGVVRVIDSDMNFNPEAVDSFDVDVWSDSDAGGISLSVTETNESTGIFEGTVFFTATDASSGSRLNVNEGDTVTAEYEDNTLPDPYSTADELDVTATTLIGTLVPPLERAPATNLRSVDAFGNTLDSVQVDQQIQVTAELGNGQDRDQDFAYLLQVQDQGGVTVSLSWITGSLGSGQSFSPAVSWIPAEAGVYVATVFVWESVDNPTALSPPISTTITVS